MPDDNRTLKMNPGGAGHRERFLIERIAREIADGRRPPPDPDEIAQYEDELPRVGALTIGQAAKLVGLETSTLRYYEDEGLLEVPRLANGHRVFDSGALGQLITVHRLRLSGMPVRDIAKLSCLLEATPDETDSTTGTDPATASAAKDQALELLEAHASAVRIHIAELQIALAITEHKIDIFREGQA